MPGGTDHLMPFKFIASKNGHREELTFYARTRNKAAAMALDWGKRRGYKMSRRKEQS